ncbi:hypothetical protein MHH85_10900 [Viridibacillus sp. FSL E2-0187]|uniref:hypothetical protein n=1 Tax=Viridibacillus sp. FSL E2-0187 TaxID=2921362 RepID=UPI0030F7DAA2
MDFILLTTAGVSTEIVDYLKENVKNLFLPATIVGIIFTLLKTAIKNYNQTTLESKISSNTERFIDYSSLAFVTGFGYFCILIFSSNMNLLESGVITIAGVLFAMFFLFLAKLLIIPKSTVEGRLKSDGSNVFNFKIVKKIGKDKYLCSKTETGETNLREIYFFISNLEDYEFKIKVYKFSKKRKIINWISFVCINLFLITGFLFLTLNSIL